MKSGLRKSAVMLALVIMLLTAVIPRMSKASPEDSPAQIDLFTNKQPYDGKGPDVPSDAFGPEEVVFLHALVTYNGFPVENMLVAFHVTISSNAHFDMSAQTNMTGIATVNFTITTPPINISEDDVFGTWSVVGSVMIEQRILEDSLAFKVDWIVKLLSLETVDENLTQRDNFGIGGDVGLKITLRNVAMTLKNTTLAIVVQDELSIIVNFSLIQNFQVQPNEKWVILFCKGTLPIWAHVGVAKVMVSALTAIVSDEGVPYSPGLSTQFNVRGTDPLSIDFNDAAVVTVIPSNALVKEGEAMTLTTTVRNEGTKMQAFSVKTYFDDTLLDTSTTIDLQPYATQSFDFIPDISLLTLGNHSTRALILPMINESDLTDNEFVGTIVVEPRATHDIAISEVKVSSNNAFIGDTLQINVTVVNKGNQNEHFSLQVYGNSSLVGSRAIDGLSPASQLTVSFAWNTNSVIQGSYVISASAPLSEDANPSDNTFMDGTVQILAQETHDVAITNVQPSSNTATIGTVLEITVITKNLGNTIESFNVTAYYNSSIIGTIQVQTLEPKTQKQLTFHWDTSDAQNITTGDFVISATASPVPDEENLDNNHYTDGIVQIQTATETHDIAITNVTPSSRFVYIGDFLDVNVTVRNKGTQTESFQLTLIYDQINNVNTILVGNLNAGAERNIIFHWNTTSISAGNHTISAYATPVPLEQNTNDNLGNGGKVEFTTATKGIPLPDWFPWLLLILLLIALLTALFILFYKRRKESKTAFNSGWTAWYYTYDPYAKPPTPTKPASRKGTRTRRTRKPTTTTRQKPTHTTTHF